MFKAFIRFLFRLLYRVEIHGALQPGQRTLIIANHTSFLDAPLLWSHLPADALWVVHQQIASNSFMRRMMRAADYVLIDAARPTSLKTVIDAVETGRPVVIFPEGRITITGTFMKMYEGTAFVAAKTGATVCPITIDGAQWAKGFTRLAPPHPVRFFPRIVMRYHAPTAIPMAPTGTGKERRRKAGDELRRIMHRTRVESRTQRSIFDEFLHAVRTHGRSRVMVEDATLKTLTYGDVLKGALALGRLTSRYTKPGEAVGVMMPNASASVALVFGLLSQRRIPAILNFTSGADGVQNAMKAARVTTVFTARAFVEKGKLEPLIERLRDVRIVYLEDLRAELTLADKLWLVLYALRFPEAATQRSSPADPAAVLFTSGSEGKPKGVVLSNWSILVNIHQALAVIDASATDRLFSALPVFHSFGLTIGFVLPLVSGIPVFLYPTPLHYAIIPELFYDRDCTILFATPTFLRNYARRANPYDFRRARIVVAGAEKLTEEIRQTYYDKFGLRIIEGYGATECSPIISANSYMKSKTGTVGELMPLMECRLESVPGIEEGGILHVRGPNVMLGYWRDTNPGVLEPPSSVFGPGWYSTGDLATIDDDNNITLRGRLRRFAKVAGEMISLELVEKIAETASPKSSHAAVARPDPGRGESILIVTQDKTLQRDQLQRAARDMGAPELAIPRRVLVIDKIPLLGNGKKDYPKLAQLVEELLARN
jgi:acyl-[acyl-carrier-protein]-phospholipid O-acyltransferase/long-chain-fatty-acid--[acyl-carrier-protein] ligase